MTCEEREALSQRICNFYCDSANKSVKMTVNYFKKQNVRQSSIYYLLKKYLQSGTTKDLPQNGSPVQLSKKDLNKLVKSVNNRCGLSQRSKYLFKSMTTINSKAQCFTCSKEKIVYECKGCLKNFCLDDLLEHRKMIIKQFDQIENDRNLLQQAFLELTDNITKYFFIEKINQWEYNSIEKIKQKAKESKDILIEYINKSIHNIKIEFNKLSNQIKEIRQENEFNELDLDDLKIKLMKLKDDLDNPSNISIKEEPTTFINNISVIVFEESNNRTNLIPKWNENGITIAGGNSYGNRLNQLFHPEGIYILDDQFIYIVEWGNHRIVLWNCYAKSGYVIAGGNGCGNRNDQLNWPTDIILDKQNDSIIISDWGNKRVVRWPRQRHGNGQIIISNIDCRGLAIDNNGNLYISDHMNHEVRKWRIGENHGTLVAGGNGKGNNLDQLDCPTYIFVDKDDSVYISDFNNHRVMRWIKGAANGIIVAGGNGQGNSLKQLSNPYGIIVDQSGNIYVADAFNHRVMCWRQGTKQGTIVVGGNRQGQKPNQFDYPTGLSFDRHGNLYVSDNGNHRIQKFQVYFHSLFRFNRRHFDK